MRKIGAALVEAAPPHPRTYGGYHFAVLNSPTPNGISGPGGYVLVTRGALDLARSEDEVAGVLAHEIAHVSLKHGEAVIRGAGTRGRRSFGALGRVVGRRAAAAASSRPPMRDDLRETSPRASRGQLADTGYGSELEFKADLEGTYILYDAGYDAASISKYLAALPDRPDDGVVGAPRERRAHRRPRAARRRSTAAPFDGGVGRRPRALARFRRALRGRVARTRRGGRGGAAGPAPRRPRNRLVRRGPAGSASGRAVASSRASQIVSPWTRTRMRGSLERRELARRPRRASSGLMCVTRTGTFALSFLSSLRRAAWASGGGSPSPASRSATGNEHSIRTAARSFVSFDERPERVGRVRVAADDEALAAARGCGRPGTARRGRAAQVVTS